MGPIERRGGAVFRYPRAYRSDLARRVQRNTGRTYKECRAWVDAASQALKDLVMSGDPEVVVVIRGFGRLSMERTKARAQRGVRLGNEKRFVDRYRVPARRRIAFYPSKAMRAALKVPCSERPWEEAKADQRVGGKRGRVGARYYHAGQERARRPDGTWGPSRKD